MFLLPLVFLFDTSVYRNFYYISKALQVCDNCQEKSPTRTAKCKRCEQPFAKKGKSLESYIPPSKSNPTTQKEIIHGRARVFVCQFVLTLI